MKLEDIVWPVFDLGCIDLKTSNGLVYYEIEYINKETLDIGITKYIIDDKNIQGSTLGKRRMHIIQAEGKVIAPIKRGVYFLADLIKLARAKVWFIDNTGTVFQYKKTIRAKLTCHKLKNIIPGHNVGVIVEVEGIPQRFKLLYRPTSEYTYVGLLYYNHSYILYGMYMKPFEPSYRKL